MAEQDRPTPEELEHESDLNIVRFYYEALMNIIVGDHEELSRTEVIRLRKAGFITQKQQWGSTRSLTRKFYDCFEEVRLERVMARRAETVYQSTIKGMQEYQAKRESVKWATA